MNLEAEFTLSFYKDIAEINNKHNVMLAQHVNTGCFFVKKTLSIYNFDVYHYLKDHHVKGVPQIYEIVKDGDHLIVIEEYINGRSLRNVLDTDGPLGETAAMEIIGQLCDILTALHTANPPIIHRDIKPSNLIITNDGMLKLIDFNAAKMVKTQDRQDTILMGTAGYAAPEQYGFAASSALTDIYAIGVLTNELLTGKLPIQQTVSGRMSPVINKCLQLEAGKRYLNVAQLKKALPRPASVQTQKTDPPQSWLPPGFRTKKVWSILLAVLLYAFVFYLGLNLEVYGVPAERIWPYRIICLLMFLSIILFSGNYRGIQSKFPMARNRGWLVRILGIILWSMLILIAWILIMQFAYLL